MSNPFILQYSPINFNASAWASDGTFYGTWSNSLYRSDDFLQTRTLIDSHSKANNRLCIAMVTNVGSIIWGSADDTGSDIRRSTDGVNFSTVLDMGINSGVWHINQSPTTGSIFIGNYQNYVGTNRADVWRSQDDGVNWTKVIDGTVNGAKHVHFTHVSESGRVYVHTGDTGQKHFYYSDDDGDSWTDMNTDVHPTAIISFIKDGTETLIIGEDYKNPMLIRKSVDYGSTWTDVFTGPTLSNVQDIFVMLNFGTGRILAFTRNDQFAVQTPYWALSTDYGETWHNVNPDSTDSDAYDGISYSSMDGYRTNYNGWFFCVPNKLFRFPGILLNGVTLDGVVVS